MSDLTKEEVHQIIDGMALKASVIDPQYLQWNGCTMAPDWQWLSRRGISRACNKHDVRYSVIIELRKYADQELKKDVQSKGWKWLDDVMYYFVKHFGRLFT